MAPPAAIIARTASGAARICVEGATVVVTIVT
jgi:hypothetical protein